MSKKQKRLVILVFFSLLFLIILFTWFVFSTNQASPIPTGVSSPSTVPSQASNATNNVTYTYGSMSRMEEIYTHLKPLSSSGIVARQNLVSLTNGETGTTYSTDDFFIQYDKPFNVFDAYIKSINVAKARQETLQWFAQQGISGTDICNLPLTFVPSYTLIQQLAGRKIMFNPIPDGC